MIKILVLLSWSLPILYVIMAFFGYVNGKHICSKNNGPPDSDLLIIQIPTIGNYRTVNKIFYQIRNYNLPLPLKCWVIIEEGDEIKNYKADTVIVVPKNFKCLAHAKARALEYARRRRLDLIDNFELTNNYIIVQSDDDSIPSRELLIEAIYTNVDVIIGTVRPKFLGLFGLLMDYERPFVDIRTTSFFTNNKIPIWGHGESTIYRGRVEQKINYEFMPLNGKIIKEVPVMGNEDMYFLHKAELNGFSLYHTLKTVSICSPVNLSDAIKQRRRWLWGNFNIVYIKRLLPFNHVIRFLLCHVCAFILYPISLTSPLLIWLNIIQLSSLESLMGIIGFISWYLLRFVSLVYIMGFKHGIFGTITSKLTSALNFFVMIIGIFQGDPKKFEVIKKPDSV
ncbi:hypothetical protein JW865_02955 [Candidatus Bathyarchaeota archaeon]|nr:hypothetical protein [Candidatus Bathyarchaeota archaeon]